MKKQKLLPKTILQRFFENCSGLLTFVKAENSLPTKLYRGVTIYIIISALIDFLDFHDENTGYHVFEVLVHAFCFLTDESSQFICFLVFCLLEVFFFLYLIAVALVYNKTKHLPRWLVNTTLIISELFAPLLILFAGSGIGNNIGTMCESFSSSYLIYVIISLVLTFFLVSVYELIVFNSVAWCDGRSTTYTSRQVLLFYSSICLIRIFSRSMQITEGVPKMVFGVISFILVLAFSVYVFHNNIFIHPWMSKLTFSLCAGSAVVCIVSAFVSVDWVIKILVLLVVFFITYIVASMLFDRRQASMIELLTNIVSEEIDFEDAFPKINVYFYQAMLEGFRQGHPYVLSFKPFLAALANAPDDRYLWEIYIKVLAVYNNRTADLADAVEEARKQDFFDYKTILFLNAASSLVETRAREVTKECKSTLKKIDVQTRQLKFTLVKYWQAVQNGEEGSVYTYGQKANEQMSDVELLYDQTIKNWPNVSFIYKKYAGFLRNVCYDRPKAAFMEKCAESTKVKSIDNAEINAKTMFIMLPPVLPDEEMIQQMKVQNPGGSVLSHSSFNIEDPLDDMDDEDEMASQSLLSTGRNAPIPINRAINILTISFIAIVFICGIIVTSALVVSKYSTYRQLLTFMNTFTNLLLYMPRASYNIVSDGIEINGDSLTDAETNQLLGIDEVAVENYEQVLADIPRITESVDTYLQMTSEAMDYTTNVSQLLRTDEVKQNHPTIVNGVVKSNKYYTLFQNAITSVTGFFFQYTKEKIISKTDIRREYWYLYVLENAYRVCENIMTYASYIAHDMLRYADDIVTLTKVMTIVFSVVSVIFIPITIVLLNKQKKQFSNVVKAMSKIPSIVIIQHISEMTKGKENESDDMKDESIFAVQDIDGIPNGKLLFWFILNVVLFIAECVVNMYLLTSKDQTFRALPFQMKNSAHFMNVIYDNIAVVKRILAVSAGNPVSSDSASFIYRIYEEGRESIFTLADNLFFGEEEEVKYGYIYESSVNRDTLFDARGQTDWDDVHSLYKMLPPVVSIELLTSEMSYFSRNSKDTSIFGKDKKRFNQLIHFESEHLASETVASIVEGTGSDISNIVKTQTVIAILSPCIMFVIQVLALISFILIQYKILTTFRFALMSLGMLDQKFIQTNEKLMSIASGNLSAQGSSESVPSYYITCINETSQDAIINTTQTFEIISANNATKGLPGYTNNVRTLEEFLTIPPEAYAVIQSQKPTCAETEIMFKEDGGNEFKMKVKIFKSSHNDLYFILHRERAMEKLEKEREKKKQAISNITSRIIPHDQRDLFKDQLFRPVAAENILILSCRFINFEVGTEESVEGTLDSITKFNRAVIKAAKEIDDCCISKKHNTMTFILFNTKSQKRQLKSSFQDISKFVKEVYADCKEQGISVSFALTFSKNLIMGSLSQNRSQFNLYSPDLHANYTISRYAPDGYVYIQKLLNDLPPSLKEKIQPVDNTDIEVVNKVKVEDFSSE